MDSCTSNGRISGAIGSPSGICEEALRSPSRRVPCAIAVYWMTLRTNSSSSHSSNSEGAVRGLVRRSRSRGVAIRRRNQRSKVRAAVAVVVTDRARHWLPPATTSACYNSNSRCPSEAVSRVRSRAVVRQGGGSCRIRSRCLPCPRRSADRGLVLVNLYSKYDNEWGVEFVFDRFVIRRCEIGLDLIGFKTVRSDLMDG